MTISISIVVMLISYILGAITKMFIKIVPDNFIPIQNVYIGLLSGLVCFFLGLYTNLLTSIIECTIATLGAGGMSQIIDPEKIIDKEVKG